MFPSTSKNSTFLIKKNLAKKLTLKFLPLAVVRLRHVLKLLHYVQRALEVVELLQKDLVLIQGLLQDFAHLPQ